MSVVSVSMDACTVTGNKMDKPIQMTEHELLVEINKEVEQYKKDKRMYSLTLALRLIKLLEQTEVVEH